MANIFDQSIGLQIKLRRGLIGMTQSVLGEKLGLTFQQIQKYEKGTNKVGSGKLYEIAKILDVPVEHFFEGITRDKIDKKMNLKDSGKMEYTVDSKLPDREIILLLKFFSRIQNKKMRESIINLAKSLSNSKIEEK